MGSSTFGTNPNVNGNKFRSKHMKVLLLWALDRLKEPSTWQGFTVIVTSVSSALNPELADKIAEVGASVFGLIYVIRKG